MPLDVVHVKGMKGLRSFFNRYQWMFKEELAKELGRIIKRLQADIIRSMESTPTDPSRMYYNKDLGKYVAPSMYGHPPAVQTKDLINNIKTIVRVNKKEAELYVTDKTIYVNYLEEGTTKMRERPAFIPALERLFKSEELDNRLMAVISRSARASR